MLCKPKDLSLIPRIHVKTKQNTLDMVVQAFNSNVREAEAARSLGLTGQSV